MAAKEEFPLICLLAFNLREDHSPPFTRPGKTS